MAANAGVHLDTGLFPDRGQPGGGFFFLRRKLGLLMKLPVKLNELAYVFCGPIGRCLRVAPVSKQIAKILAAIVSS